jgi:hypothetical protein
MGTSLTAQVTLTWTETTSHGVTIKFPDLRTHLTARGMAAHAADPGVRLTHLNPTPPLQVFGDHPRDSHLSIEDPDLTGVFIDNAPLSRGTATRR